MECVANCKPYPPHSNVAQFQFNFSLHKMFHAWIFFTIRPPVIKPINKYIEEVKMNSLCIFLSVVT